MPYLEEDMGNSVEKHDDKENEVEVDMNVDGNKKILILDVDEQDQQYHRKFSKKLEFHVIFYH